jgi:hypothetical protein
VNTFDLKFINLAVTDWRSQENRDNTTCAQLLSRSPLLYYPEFKIVLSSNGKDWDLVLDQLSELKTQPFYADDVDRPVEFIITFDFAYSSFSQEIQAEFMSKAKLVLL